MATAIVAIGPRQIWKPNHAVHVLVHYITELATDENPACHKNYKYIWGRGDSLLDSNITPKLDNGGYT